MSSIIVRSSAEMEATRKDESWGTLRWLAGGAIGNADGLTLGRVLIGRGQENPRHCHPNCEEILYLMSGRLQHSLGDQTYILGPGDTLTIPRGVFHNARSIGEVDADMIVAYDSAERQFLLENR